MSEQLTEKKKQWATKVSDSGKTEAANRWIPLMCIIIKRIHWGMASATEHPLISRTDLPKKSRYRPEIDGLRAFAVTAVIINHINKASLPSGYLGVDIFFVISGYVITSSLATRKSASLGNSLASFYERRIKRLLPALLLFVLVTSILICVVNPNPEFGLNTGLRSLVGLSNLYLRSNATDYFAQSTELNPFTHTWSLGVEEQFYLFFPFLAWFSGFTRQTKNGARNFSAWIFALSCLSVFSFVYLYNKSLPTAYFSMPTRFWEMAAGCLTFLALQRKGGVGKRLQTVPALLVFVLMIGVLVLPLAAAIPATLAIVALTVVLLACLREGGLAFRFLTLKPVVYVGLASYSLYLWHWGILCISRWSVGLSAWSTPILILIILGFSFLSYEYVEKPFRRLSLPNSQLTFACGGLALFVSGSIVSLLANPSIGSRLALVSQEQGNFQRGRQGQINYTGPVTGRRNKECGAAAKDLTRKIVQASLKKCLWEPVGSHELSPVVAIVGDSHAHQLFPIAEQLASDFRLPVYNFQYSGCLVPHGADQQQLPECKIVNDVPRWLHQELRRPIVFVVASIADPFLHFGSEADQRRRVKDFKAAFKDVLQKGDSLIVVAPNPKFLDIDNTISDICGQAPWSRLNPLCQKEHKFLAQTQRQARAVYLQQLHQWSRQDSRVVIVDPFDLICAEKKGYCYAESNGESKYWDASHLNINAVVSTYPLYKSALERILRGSRLVTS